MTYLIKFCIKPLKMKHNSPSWALNIFVTWDKNREACLQMFSDEALGRIGSSDVSQGYLLYLEKVKDVFIEPFRLNDKVTSVQLKALHEFPQSTSSSGPITVLQEPRFDIYVSNYLQSLEYTLDRTCFAIDSSKIWLKYYKVITALASCPWRHQSSCIALRKDLLQCICKRIVLDNPTIFTDLFQDRVSAEVGQPLSGVELYNAYNKVLGIAVNCEQTHASSLYSLADIFRVLLHREDKTPRQSSRIQGNHPLGVYQAFIALFDETSSFCATNDISDRITGRFLYTLYESALYYLGRFLPAIYLDIAIRISGHIVSPSIIQELFQRSAAEIIFERPIQIKKPFEDAADLACNILQRGVAMHPKVTLLYVSLMELLRHRSLEQHGSAVIAQLYDELLQKDVDACCDITQEAFVATKYILRYTLETAGITAMISQVRFILEHRAVSNIELWEAVLYIICSYFGDAQAFLTLTSHYDVLGMPLINCILKDLYRSVSLLQCLWHITHAFLKKELQLDCYFRSLCNEHNVFSFCYHALNSSDICDAKGSVDALLTSLLTRLSEGRHDSPESKSSVELACSYSVIILLLLLRIHLEKYIFSSVMDDLSDYHEQAQLLKSVFAPLAYWSGSQQTKYADLSSLCHPSPLLHCISMLSQDFAFSVWDVHNAIDRLFLFLRASQNGLSMVGLPATEDPTPASLFADSSMATRLSGCSHLCILTRESVMSFIDSRCLDPTSTYFCFAALSLCGAAASDAAFRIAAGPQEGVAGALDFTPVIALTAESLSERPANFILSGINPVLAEAALFQQRYLPLSSPFTAPEVFGMGIRSINDVAVRPETPPPGVPARLLCGGISNLQAYDRLVNKDATELQQEDHDASPKQNTRTVLIHGQISLPETVEKRVAAVGKAALPFTTPLGVAAFIEKVYGENPTHRVRIDTWKVPLPDIRSVFDRVRRYDPAGAVREAPPHLLQPVAQLPTSEQAEAVLALGPAE
ncbi:Hypothetical protein GLP15_2067 [Giardia lamblia P15]|uniref:Uncharacterized protein n=1 Tax=Giardia intestinalis (strain P15) TaxID=658858 RepID=E1F020_GIAIA|nr:Hypothetical protein GLP15_2067 [Giardia lamblia P15]